MQMVARVFDSAALSHSSISICAAFGFRGTLNSGSPASAASCAASMVWYFVMIHSADFGPRPGTPGMLSEVSPIRALRSMNSSGVTPHSCITSSG